MLLPNCRNELYCLHQPIEHRAVAFNRSQCQTRRLFNLALHQQTCASSTCTASAVAPAHPSHRRVQRQRYFTAACHASFFQDQCDDVSSAPEPGEQGQAAQQATLSALDLAAADWVFEHPSGVSVCVFGVDHLELQPEIGEWVLANRPAAVVVETACTPEHGAEPGRAVTCRDQVQGAPGMFLRVFCQIAAALQEQGPAAREPGGVWSQAVSNFNGEQLAYIAAFATGAQLLFGDRPKHITYRRLFGCTSLEQLDAAYAAEVAASYSTMLTQVQHADTTAVQQAQQQCQQHQDQLASTAVWDIMMREREAVMLGVVDQVCSKGLVLLPGMPKPSLALVVGSAHLPGLQSLWMSGSWRQLVGEGGLNSSSSPVLQAPLIDQAMMEAEGAGAKRGLLEALLQLSMPQEVLDDVQDCYPPVGQGEEHAREWTYEIFSTCRMQLAALPEGLLQQVCGAFPGVKLPELLEPLRQLRPVNGGRGWDPDIGMQLRGLNFDLTVDTPEE